MTVDSGASDTVLLPGMIDWVALEHTAKTGQEYEVAIGDHAAGEVRSGTRDEFLRGYRVGNSVTLVGSQDSSALSALSESNCLIYRPAREKGVREGDTVPCYLF